MATASDPAPILVRLYGGTRLYDTVAGRYRSLEELRRWRASGVPFRVVEAGSGAEITAVLLA